jgi:cellulose synthase/poly-beta-1,6-N-acetylglucosamine synthase-like glycosyltransferase
VSLAWVFWIAVALLAYAYGGYFLFALVGGSLRRRDVACADCEPAVTVIIAAHNEASCIRATLEHQLALDYPAAKRQVIVVSDASTDGTDEIVRSFAGQGVRLLRQEPRRGKTAALNLAAARATGAVLVFADANSLYAPDAVRRLVRNFADPSVGYVTGRLVYDGRGTTATGLGCRLYMAYEDRLRRAETSIGSVIGVNGGIDAVRRSLYRPMRDDQLPDFVLPLRVAEAGYRVVYEPSATATEETLSTARQEYRMRVRVAQRAWWAMWDVRGALNVRRHGLLSLQVISHKVLRYVAWAALPMAYGSAIALWSSGSVYQGAAVAGSAALLVAAAGGVFERFGRPPGIMAIPYYFLLINAAAAHALVRFLRGHRQVTWAPRLG